MNQLYVPTWAEKSLSKPTAFDVAELELLREFYDAWEALHAIQGDKREKSVKAKYEAAAELLVSKAHVLRNMKGARSG